MKEIPDNEVPNFDLVKEGYDPGYKVSIFFAWYDFWIGWFYDRKRTLYICFIPMVVIKIERTQCDKVYLDDPVPYKNHRCHRPIAHKGKCHYTVPVLDEITC